MCTPERRRTRITRHCPLIPVDAIPFTMCFWKKINTRMMGNASMAPAAIVSPIPVRYWDRNTGSPTGIVTRFGSVMEIKGHRKSFQFCMKIRIAKEEMAEVESGTAS